MKAAAIPAACQPGHTVHKKNAAFLCHASAAPWSTFFMILAMSLALPGSLAAAELDSLQQRGIKAYEAGNHTEALKLFSQAVSQEPNDARALYNQGTALYKTGNHAAAADSFAAAAEGLPQKDRAGAAYNQGRALLSAAADSSDPTIKKERLLTAKHAFLQALRDDPHLMAARTGIAEFRRAYAKAQQQPPASRQEKPDSQPQAMPPQQDGQQKQSEQLNRAKADQHKQAKQNQDAEAETTGQPNRQEGNAMAARQQGVRRSIEEIKEELRRQGGQQDNLPAADPATPPEVQNNQDKGAGEKTGSRREQIAEDQQQSAGTASDRPQSVDPGAAFNQTSEGKAAGADAQDPRQEQSSPAKTESTLTEILDGEKALHEMRRLRMQQQRPTGGKDW